MKKYFIFQTVIFLFVALSVRGQNINLFDKLSLQPIEGVEVLSKNNYALTDKSGMANISNFNITDSITIRHYGYKPFNCSYEELSNMGYTVYLIPNLIDLDAVVVAVNRTAQNRAEIPNKIISLNKKDVELYNSQTIADMLKTSDEVFIQKSQLGGGSPMIRGYAANRVLIVTDGVRMNNAIFRSGNLQNIISLDPNAIDDIEIILGPGSVVYGSDAIGGVMSFATLKAQLAAELNSEYTINAMTRYASANEEKTEHIDFNIGLKKIAFRSSFSFSDFGDLKMGSTKHPEYRQNYFVETQNNIDLLKKNKNPDLQKYSAYSQMNIMQKVLFVPNSYWDINYAFHFSKLSDVPRYDRLIQYKGDSLKYAQWYYGPQIWQMHNINILHKHRVCLYDKLNFIAGYQNFKESRHDRKFMNPNIRERYEEVHVFSANLDFKKTIFNKVKLFYGAEYLFNRVYSKAYKRNIISEEKQKYASRYPDNSKYYSGAIYLSFNTALSPHINLSGGARYNANRVEATLDTQFYQFPLVEISNQTRALIGSVGVTFRHSEKNILNLNLSTGFRAPNIDDLSKIFDSEPGNVIVPNPQIVPEYVYNADFSYKNNFNNIIETNLTLFYSYLTNALVRGDFKFNGKDSIIYDGEMSKVQALVNTSNAKVYGVSFGVKVKLGRRFSFKSNINYTKGFDSKKLPLRHVSPLFANTHLYYADKKFKLDFYIAYNGKISYDKLAESERKKTHIYARDTNGNPYSPSWYTLNISSSWQINEGAKLNFAIENILNHRYRPYSSGIVAAGRNFIVSFIFTFGKE